MGTDPFKEQILSVEIGRATTLVEKTEALVGHSPTFDKTREKLDALVVKTSLATSYNDSTIQRIRSLSEKLDLSARVMRETIDFVHPPL